MTVTGANPYEEIRNSISLRYPNEMRRQSLRQASALYKSGVAKVAQIKLVQDEEAKGDPDSNMHHESKSSEGDNSKDFEEKLMLPPKQVAAH